MFNFEPVYDAVHNSPPGSIKQSSSQPSSSRCSNAISDRTQRIQNSPSAPSPSTASNFFCPALINVYGNPPPKDIQDIIDAIYHSQNLRGAPKASRTHIYLKYSKHAALKKKTRASVGKNDFVIIFDNCSQFYQLQHNLSLRTNAD